MHITHDPQSPAAEAVDWPAFLAVDVRAGTIVTAEAFPQARSPSYVLIIDFGSTIGLKKSVAQITLRYPLDALPGRRVMAVVNLPPRQIGPMRSQVLLLGFADDNGGIVLADIDNAVPNGARLA